VENELTKMADLDRKIERSNMFLIEFLLMTVEKSLRFSLQGIVTIVLLLLRSKYMKKERC